MTVAIPYPENIAHAIALESYKAAVEAAGWTVHDARPIVGLDPGYEDSTVLVFVNPKGKIVRVEEPRR